MSLAAKVLILALLAIGAALAGMWTGVSWEQGQEARRARAAERVYTQALLERAAKNRTDNAEVAHQLAVERAARRRDTLNYRERLKNARTILTATCPQPAGTIASAAGPPAAPARITCGPDCIRLWNAALAQGLPAALGGPGADAGAGGAGVAEIEDLFANLGDNAAACNGLRSQVMGWQRWACAQGLAEAALCAGK